MLRTLAFLLITASLLYGCAPPPVEETRYRIAVMRFQQETCTFCPGGDAPTEDWTRLGPLLKGEALLDSGPGMRGFVQQARDYGDMEIVPLTSPHRLFGGSSRSWSTKESFDTFIGQMLEELRQQMPVDGVYLALHGALAVRNIPKPEAEIARRFREVIGPEVPIAGTFDLHGNEDQEFLEAADFAFVTKRYPHYDMYRQGQRAARAIHMTLTGDYKVTSATRKPGIITPTVVQWTGAAPSSEIMERARRWEDREAGAFVSVFYGFPWSDVPDVGATIHVMTNNDQSLADHIADDMNEYFWQVREAFANEPLPGPTEAASIVSEAQKNGRTPVVVGDHSDRPGDATHIMQALQVSGVTRVVYAGISSPDVLERLKATEAAVGDPFDEEVGGITASGGNPVRIQGRIEYLGPWFGYDNTAAVAFGDGNLVMIVPAYTQVRYPEGIDVGPINHEDYEVFVVKSRVHFRRGFDETNYAKAIVVVEAPEPTIGSSFLDALPYENVELENYYPYGVPPER